MTAVGIRELRQRASELLRRVEAGETFEVTDRGRPVAVLGPLPDAGALARLRASGEIESGGGSLDDLPPPMATPTHAERPSQAIVRRRRDER